MPEAQNDMIRVTLLHDLGADVRFAARQLLKHPAFTALAALTLALGIGGTVALFSVVNGLILRPLPIVDEDRVVSFWSAYNWRGVEFDYVKERAQAYESLAAYSNNAVTLRTETGSSLLLSTIASAELFDVLGVPALVGRTFREGEDRPGAEPVVVLTHGLWQQEFGGDRSIVGRRINLSGTQTTVIGVMPEGFYFPTPDMEAFLPLDLDPDSEHYQGNGWLVLTGRLRPGITEAQVEDDVRAIAVTIGERWDYPDAWDKTRNPHVIPVREYLLGEVRPTLLLLLGAVALVLLMACANVAALILTRTADRTGEMSVRTALGAGRGRLARQVLTESVLLGLVSGVMGMGLAVGLFDVLVASLPLPANFGETLSLDWTTLAGSLVLAVGTGSLISLAPMRSLLRGDLSGSAMGERIQTGAAASQGRMQSALVVAEVLLAVVLATGAGLLVRTVAELRSLDPGLVAEGVLTVTLLTPENELTPEELSLFFDAVVERAEALPGVTAAGLINRVPLRDGGWQSTLTLQDRPDLTGDLRPNSFFRSVTPRTFEALGVEVIEGRNVLPSDDVGTPLVAVVNETFARRMFGNESALGRIILGNGYTTEPIEIVGVIKDVAVEDLVGETPMAAYYPWEQMMRGSSYGILMVKTEFDPADLGAPIRTLVHELHPSAAIGRMETMQEAIDGEMVEALRLRFFLGLFSVLGIVLGTVGVYGVVSYAVQRRQAEFGIRMALGAGPGRLLGDVVKKGMIPVLIGVVGGSATALLASTVLARFLFEVKPTDPASLLVAAGALLVAGALAALIPAVRASTTDPAVALRAE